LPFQEKMDSTPGMMFTQAASFVLINLLAICLACFLSGTVTKMTVCILEFF